jgi:hypothetical protein
MLAIVVMILQQNPPLTMQSVGLRSFPVFHPTLTDLAV